LDLVTCGGDTKPWSLSPPSSPLTGTSERAMSRVQAEAMASSWSPLPVVCSTDWPLWMSVNNTVGKAIAYLMTKSTIWPTSVVSDLRNFSRAGVLKNRSSTRISVPFGPDSAPS